ncbi:MAG: hypothetical protein H6559_22800 [Lewinellaceae bacterium]|nr:hypothetical protein [Lewinellaceae bacterium]
MKVGKKWYYADNSGQ